MYDLAGRVKQRGSDSIEYDIFNNMTTYNNDTYRYDANNQRIVKTENGETTYYIKSGLETLAEYDGDKNLKAEYYYGVDGIVAKHDVHEGFHWFYKDPLGSTRHLNANTLQRDYFPYGEDLHEAGTETNYLFTGKELDSHTSGDLYYFGARYYDPSIGRWLVPDPKADIYPQWSPYNYALNNPLRLIDPDGMQTREADEDEEKQGFWNNFLSGIMNAINSVRDPVYSAMRTEQKEQIQDLKEEEGITDCGLTPEELGFQTAELLATSTPVVSVGVSGGVINPGRAGLIFAEKDVYFGTGLFWGPKKINVNFTDLIKPGIPSPYLNIGFAKNFQQGNLQGLSYDIGGGFVIGGGYSSWFKNPTSVTYISYSPSLWAGGGLDYFTRIK